MGEETRALDMESSEENTTRRNHLVHDLMVDLYPLSSYYFVSRDPIRVKDEIISDRVVRLKSNYAAHGMRTCVEAVLLVGECIGMWWRPNFETLMYPFSPPNVKHPKECIKLFLVRLPVNQQFVVPKNFKLLAVTKMKRLMGQSYSKFPSFFRNSRST